MKHTNNSIEEAIRLKHSEGTERANRLIFGASSEPDPPITDPPPGSFDNGPSDPGPPPPPGMASQLREAARFVSRFPGREVSLEDTKHLFS